MDHYRFFSRFYDLSTERLYRPYRRALADALRPELGPTVVDVACGTGQNFGVLRERLGGESARVIGVDVSPAMLARAGRRIQREGWRNVELRELDARSGDVGELPPLDHAVCTLGLSVIPDWKRAFELWWDRLRPGGQFLILDTFAKRRVPQTWWVERIAGADTSRRFWEPLEARSEDFECRDLGGSAHVFGGSMLLASGLKPG